MVVHALNEAIVKILGFLEVLQQQGVVDVPLERDHTLHLVDRPLVVLYQPEQGLVVVLQVAVA
jgi:hypothetical protein